MKRPIRPLVGDRITLRLLEESDLPMTRAWRNQDEIRKWFLSSDPISAAGHRAWYEHYADRDDDFVFIIEETEELRQSVGQASLYRVDWLARRAEFGRILIGVEAARGRGLARSATLALMDLARHWQLAEVQLDCLEANTRALALYAGCGFCQMHNSGGVIRMVRRIDDVRAAALQTDSRDS